MFYSLIIISYLIILKMLCAYCGSSHATENCDDPFINVIYECIKQIYINLITQYPSTQVESRFKTILIRRYTRRDLLIIGIKFAHISVRNTKEEIIEKLYQYFTSRIHIPRPIEHSDSVFAWRIDRTPSVQTELIMYQINYTPIHYPTPPTFITEFRTKYDIRATLVSNDNNEEEHECSICLENVTNKHLVSLNCEHKFCGSCIIKLLKTHNKYEGPSCALCRKLITNVNITNQEIYESISNYCL
jgi:hypothetical protein